MNILGIIQARMGSTRRPKKVLAKIQGVPILQHLLNRIKGSSEINKIVIATTEEPDDDILVEWCLDRGLDIFRGSAENVLSRFYQCASYYNADIIVRITADDPLKDPVVIDYAVNKLKKDKNLDYVSNTIDPSYPEGIDVEVFRFKALEIAFKEATQKTEIEHVTPYIWSHPEIFGIENFYADEDMSKFRLTVDYEKDITVISAILSHFKSDPLVGYKDIVKFLKNHPEIAEINSNIMRNEGYHKSLIEEKIK